MKKPITERIGDFLTGRGFYIVLFLCIAAIGISGYYLMNTLSAPAADDPVTAMDPDVTVSVPVVTPEPTPESEAPSPVPTPSAPVSSPVMQPEAVSTYTWPVKGELLTEFSLQALCYDETMGDFRTHSGIDIAAAAGTSVLAIADGTVTDVSEDPWLGTVVTVSHAGGVESLSCNLAPSPTVAKGDTVTCGQVLGAVGSTAMAETALPAHLHLEMREDGVSVDPVNYLPK